MQNKISHEYDLSLLQLSSPLSLISTAVCNGMRISSIFHLCLYSVIQLKEWWRAISATPWYDPMIIEATLVPNYNDNDAMLTVNSCTAYRWEIELWLWIENKYPSYKLCSIKTVPNMFWALAKSRIQSDVAIRIFGIRFQWLNTLTLYLSWYKIPPFFIFFLFWQRPLFI